MMKILLNWLLLLLVLTVNALANILPINGLNTGEISGLYPNFFVPAGFTFSIWGVIYLFLIAYNIGFTYYTIHREKDTRINYFLDKINPFFLLTCILNAGWIFAWHYLQLFISLLIMTSFLVALLVIFVQSRPLVKGFSSRTKLILETPFVIYLGWISVATIANVTAGLVKIQWTGWGISGIYWSSLMIVIAIALGLFFTLRYKVISYGLVIAWALWGIQSAQSKEAALLFWIPVSGIAALLIAILYTLLRNRSRISIH